MDKRGLIIAASQRSGITQKDIQLALEPILESIVEALSRGDKIALHNFGTFFIKEVQEKKSRNPKTGQEIMVAAKKVIKFRATALVEIK